MESIVLFEIPVLHQTFPSMLQALPATTRPSASCTERATTTRTSPRRWGSWTTSSLECRGWRTGESCRRCTGDRGFMWHQTSTGRSTIPPGDQEELCFGLSRAILDCLWKNDWCVSRIKINGDESVPDALCNSCQPQWRLNSQKRFGLSDSEPI